MTTKVGSIYLASSRALSYAITSPQQPSASSSPSSSSSSYSTLSGADVGTGTGTVTVNGTGVGTHPPLPTSHPHPHPHPVPPPLPPRVPICSNCNGGDNNNTTTTTTTTAATNNTNHAPPKRPVVLLSSALCAPFTIWDPVVPQLTSLGFDVLRFDAPGHGLSGVPANFSSTTFDSLARDIRVLLSHLGIGRLHAWIGVSLGAATAIVFAARYPGVVERLVACDTVSCSSVNGGTPDAFGLRVADARAAGNMDTSIETTLERWFGRRWLLAHPDETERVRRVMRGTTVDGFEACCVALRSTSFDLRPLATRAGSHVGEALLLVGEKDVALFQTMEELRRRIEKGLKSARGGEGKEVKLKVVRDGGHLCFVDGFESFTNLLGKFLQT